jgi:hypothetical protein
MLSALRRALLVTQFPQGHRDQHSIGLFPDLLVTGLNPAA